jgi:hypothetical protein
MKQKKVLLFVLLLLVVGLVLAFMKFKDSPEMFSSLNVLIVALIIVLAILALYRSRKKEKEVKAGFPAEDEMSLLLKYKAGYYAFLASMYLWLFIFLFKDKFPDLETMLGGGILLSGLIAFIIKAVLSRNPNA